MPALWITASKRPSLLTWSATVLAPAMVERSPVTAPRAPAAVTASRLRPSFRPCTTTSWPCSIRSLAAIRPRPSDDPVINTRATLRLLCRPAHQGYDPGRSTRRPCAYRPISTGRGGCLAPATAATSWLRRARRRTKKACSGPAALAAAAPCAGRISKCEDDRDAECRDLADLGLQPRTVPPLSRSRGLPARAGADLSRPDLEFSRARGRDPQPRRFPHHLCR